MNITTMINDEHGRGLVVTKMTMMVAMVTENLMAVTVPAVFAWGGRDVQPAPPPRLLDDHYDGHQPIFDCCQQGFKDLQ